MMVVLQWAGRTTRINGKIKIKFYSNIHYTIISLIDWTLGLHTVGYRARPPRASLTVLTGMAYAKRAVVWV